MKTGGGVVNVNEFVKKWMLGEVGDVEAKRAQEKAEILAKPGWVLLAGIGCWG